MQFFVTADRNTPLPSHVFLEEVHADEPDGVWTVHEKVCGLLI